MSDTVSWWARARRWLELRRILQHRHAWYLQAVWGKRPPGAQGRASYFMVYRCSGCGSSLEQATPLGIEWVKIHGQRRDGLSYIPMWSR